MSDIFSTALSGMNAAIARMSNAANNIANASTTGRLPENEADSATSYIPTDVVSTSNDSGDLKLGVSTHTVNRDPAYYPAYDPYSPHANEEGFVAAPNVDIAEEIVDTLMAKNVYEANAKMVRVQKEMQESLLDTMA